VDLARTSDHKLGVIRKYGNPSQLKYCVSIGTSVLQKYNSY